MTTPKTLKTPKAPKNRPVAPTTTGSKTPHKSSKTHKPANAKKTNPDSSRSSRSPHKPHAPHTPDLSSWAGRETLELLRIGHAADDLTQRLCDFLNEVHSSGWIESEMVTEQKGGYQLDRALSSLGVAAEAFHMLAVGVLEDLSRSIEIDGQRPE